MARRPKQPVRRFRRITAVFSGGKWRWRAFIGRDGTKHAGPLRDTQAQAAADVADVQAKAANANQRPTSLREALDQVKQEAESRALQQITLNNIAYTRKVLELYWPEEHQPLEAITVESVVWMATDALKLRSPLTVRRNYMGLLHQAFQAAELPSPVPAARKTLSRQLRHVPPRMAWRPPEEVGEILKRIENYKHPCHMPNFEEDHALFTVVAYTGVRSFEFARVERADIDLKRSEMYVREPKDRSNPRTVPLPAGALPAMEFLCEGLATTAPIVRGGARRLNRMFERWKSRLDMPDLNGRMLRHSVGAGMEILGAPDTVNCLTLGHRPGSDASKRYRHAAQSHLATHLTLLGEAIQRGQSGQGPEPLHETQEAQESPDATSPAPTLEEQPGKPGTDLEQGDE